MIRSILALIACFAITLAPPAAAKGGGDEGVDILPAFAAVSMDGPFDLISLDGSNWEMVEDSVVESAAAEASVTSTVDLGSSDFLLVGSLTSTLEAAVTATLAASPPVSAPSVDTHPTPSRDEYKLKKTIITSKGTEKDIFKTLVVEKRAGESASEFQKRSERELRDAMDAGWESTP